ncbi:MAG: ATP-binding cassette domain-containing protein [Streptosporangiales bacterium]|nr:ATP-binding cassette domain-containing protein [Streptosporangiales bacterium]
MVRGSPAVARDLSRLNRGTSVEITVDRLSHVFRSPHTGESVEAVHELDLTIGSGEFVTVVGPSGCGKSTLLKAIAGLLTPTSGTITCDGTKVTGPGRDRGVVFQELAIMPWRTVRRNIGHGLEIQGVPRRERDERVAYYVDLMKLGGFEDKYPHELSGGMKQRVAVARTWASDADAILMDEPFAAVDAQTRLTLQEELLKVSQVTDRTLLFITHNTEEAVFLGDRVVVMSRRPGRVKEIVEVATPRADREIGVMLSDPAVREQNEHVLRLVREEVT